jgi:hypothetical protein
VDRTLCGWIADECGRSTVKNSLAVLVRITEQAVRDGIIEVNPARVTGRVVFKLGYEYLRHTGLTLLFTPRRHPSTCSPARPAPACSCTSSRCSSWTTAKRVTIL